MDKISARARVMAWCVLGLVVAAGVTAIVVPLGGFTDLAVYAAGGRAWSHGVALYQGAFELRSPGARLPFTYPPIAAVLFAVFAALPWPVLVFGFACSAAGCLVLVLRLAWRRSDPLPHNGSVALAASWRTVLALAVCCCALEPVWQTLLLGQVNLLLLAMVCADCLRTTTRWPRGLLTGIAGALKLTPLVFVLYFAVRRDWRAVFVSLGTFLAVTAFGWLCAPGDSRAYWFGALLDPERIGNVEFAANQSLRGFLFRLDLGTGWWIAGSLVLLGFSLYAARRSGEPLLAFGIIGLAGLLISPVSWSHHWVNLIPLLAYLAALVRAEKNVYRYCGYAVVLAMFCIGPHWLVPHGNGAELRWTWWETLLGNSYFLLGACAVVTFWLRALAAHHRFSSPRSPPATRQPPDRASR